MLKLNFQLVVVSFIIIRIDILLIYKPKLTHLSQKVSKIFRKNGPNKGFKKSNFSIDKLSCPSTKFNDIINLLNL